MGFTAGMLGYLVAELWGASLRKLEIAYLFWWQAGVVIFFYPGRPWSRKCPPQKLPGTNRLANKVRPPVSIAAMGMGLLVSRLAQPAMSFVLFALVARLLPLAELGVPTSC